MKKFAIVDIETTGSHAGANSITEIAILVHDGIQVIDSFQSLINPGTTIPPFISRLTGITNEMLIHAPRFHEIAKKIWNMTEDSVFVAHSVNFDYSFIREEFKTLGADFKRPKLCTVRLSRKVFPGNASYSLGNICKTLNIEIKNRHRAMGDAEATVRLFEKCLLNDRDNIVAKSLKKNSKESTLPPNLPIEVFNELPDKTGVYYFYNLKGDIIYVGKAINIRKRIISHFSGPTAARFAFISSIANITYTICGTELIALLLESSEIKRLFPIYNQAQKFDRCNYILTEYVDQKGIKHLVFTRYNKKLKAITHFRSFDAGREFVFHLIKDYNLCPKYCGMYSGAGPCLDHKQSLCNGICDDKESVGAYNKRVDSALKKIYKNLQTSIIIDVGRTLGEKSVVLVEEGIYKGFGYCNENFTIDTPEKAREIILPLKHNPDVQRILEAWT